MPTENCICTLCRAELPLTKNEIHLENETKKVFYGRIPVERASSMMFYEKGGIVQNLLHDLKYKGNQEVGTVIGTWHGHLLKSQHWNNAIDLVIPVPIHKNRLKKRGYNQVEEYAKALAKALDAAYVNDLLLRKKEKKTQVFKNRIARAKVKNDDFYIAGNYNSQQISNQHVLLADDIITTGATLEACSRQLLQFSDCKLNLVSIAIAR